MAEQDRIRTIESLLARVAEEIGWRSGRELVGVGLDETGRVDRIVAVGVGAGTSAEVVAAAVFRRLNGLPQMALLGFGEVAPVRRLIEDTGRRLQRAGLKLVAAGFTDGKDSFSVTGSGEVVQLPHRAAGLRNQQVSPSLTARLAGPVGVEAEMATDVLDGYVSSLREDEAAGADLGTYMSVALDGTLPGLKPGQELPSDTLLMLSALAQFEAGQDRAMLATIPRVAGRMVTLWTQVAAATPDELQGPVLGLGALAAFAAKTPVMQRAFQEKLEWVNPRSSLGAMLRQIDENRITPKQWQQTREQIAQSEMLPPSQLEQAQAVPDPIPASPAHPSGGVGR
ncbi:MAG: hypothetical protein LBR20_06450 [Propionibacteriaceae bacterium]|jgi:hypothetical protein|nr:hypothetical protein [Propionibacteriaceae bacterium]